jgi:hypothetical protein
LLESGIEIYFETRKPFHFLFRSHDLIWRWKGRAGNYQRNKKVFGRVKKSTKEYVQWSRGKKWSNSEIITHDIEKSAQKITLQARERERRRREKEENVWKEKLRFCAFCENFSSIQLKIQFSTFLTKWLIN